MGDPRVHLRDFGEERDLWIGGGVPILRGIGWLGYILIDVALDGVERGCRLDLWIRRTEG